MIKVNLKQYTTTSPEKPLSNLQEEQWFYIIKKQVKTDQLYQPNFFF